MAIGVHFTRSRINKEIRFYKILKEILEMMSFELERFTLIMTLHYLEFNNKLKR